MQLKSVESPRPRRNLEGVAKAPAPPPREVLGASQGAGAGGSLAAEHFLVRGTREQPLRRSKTVLESLLGDGDRRKQILETNLTPWCKICSLEIESQSGLPYIGTGWFVAPRTLMTAGHCVFDPLELGGWAKRITVMPGRNGDAPLPFGTAQSSSFSTTDRWQQAQEEDYDYAAIHLDEDLGTTAGTFGIAVLPDAELKDRLVNVSGYPVEPGEGRAQYFHSNRVKALTARRLFYDIDTMGGQSGSPVWAYLDGSPDPVVVGIHAYGVGGVPADLNVVANSGPRILPEVLEVIKEWIARGTPP